MGAFVSIMSWHNAGTNLFSAIHITDIRLVFKLYCQIKNAIPVFIKLLCSGFSGLAAAICDHTATKSYIP